MSVSFSKPRHWWVRAGAALVVILVASILTLVVLRSVMFKGPILPATALAQEPIIDIHCHTAGIGAGGSGCFVSKAMQSSFKFQIYLKSFGVDLASVTEAGDQLIVQRIAERVRASELVQAAVVFAMDGVIDDEGNLDGEATEFYVPNEFVFQETQKYPELFWAASINPRRTNAVELLTLAHEQGAKFVKWLPSMQWFDPSDYAFLPFYQKLVELDMPLLAHAGKEQAFTHAKDEYGDPEKLKLALDTGVTVIVAHIASTGEHEGKRDSDRLAVMMKDYPRLYSEISSLTQFNKPGYLKEALTKSAFKDRLFYGSDYPLINTAIVSPWFFSLNLTTAKIREIDAIKNPWDRDITLKQALGVPSEIFYRANRLIMDPDEIQALTVR